MPHVPSPSNPLVTQDLELCISRSAVGTGYHVKLTDSSTQKLMAESPVSCDIADLAERSNKLLLLLGSIGQPTEFLIDFGRALAKTLLPEAIQAGLIGFLLRHRSSGKAVCLRLRVEVPRLREIPWEYTIVEAPASLLASEKRQENRSENSSENRSENRSENWLEERKDALSPSFLARLERVHLVRIPHLPLSPSRISHGASNSKMDDKPAELGEGRVRMLLVAADPQTAEYPALPHLHAEIRSIRAALQSPDCRNLDLRVVEGVTRTRLQQELGDWRPHVLYFTGHGSDDYGGRLHLHRGADQAEPIVAGNELADWLEASPIRLVVLSACDTHQMAHTLSMRGIPAVLAMQMPLRSTVAESFARNLFSYLAQPVPVPEALWWARQREPETGYDWGVPILYLQGEGQIFHRSVATITIDLPGPGNIDFYGRASLLGDIDLSVRHRRRLALIGLGGIGKTELALQYALRYATYYPGGVFWIDARSCELIDTKLEEIGESYRRADGIHRGEWDEFGRKEKVRWARQRLQKLTSPYLLIFDDVQHHQDLQDRLPVSPSCHLLFTTRQPGTVEELATILPVPPLDSTSAHSLLTQGTTQNFSEQTETIEEIASLVGYHPLALRLLSSSIQQRKMSFAHCVELLRRQREALPALDLVDATIGTSYKNLSGGGKSLLRLAACFGVHGISAEILRNAYMAIFAKISPRVYERTLAELDAYCLIGRENLVPGEQEGRLSLHELVQDFARRQLSRSQREKYLSAVAKRFIHRLLDAEDTGVWRNLQSDIIHCNEVLSLYRKWGVSEGVRPLILEVAHYYQTQGDYEQALRLYVEGRQHAENELRTGDAGNARELQRDIAELGMRQATVEQSLGRTSEALAHIQEGLEWAIVAYPPDASELADHHLGFGLILKLQGRYAEAETCYRKALNIRQTAHGYFHVEVARCLNNLGTLYESYGQTNEAIEAMSKALDIDEQLRGRDHPMVAIRLNNLGRFFATQQRWEEAIELHGRALQINRAGYQEDHCDIASTLYYLGVTYSKLGKYDIALSSLLEAESIYSKHFPPEHRFCRNVATALAELRQKQRAAIDDHFQ